MSSTVIENQICEGCGADIREGSQFCYNCGAAVAEEVRGSGAKKTMPDAMPAVPGTSQLLPKSKLRTAADLRKRKRAYNREPVSVEWVEREGSGTLFLVGALVLSGIAILLMILALYLR